VPNHDTNAEQEESDDDDVTDAGLHSILKAYAPADGKKPGKTPATITTEIPVRAQPKAKTSAKAKASSSIKNKAPNGGESGTAVKRQKIDIGSTGQNGKVSKGANGGGLGILSLETDEVPIGSDDNISAADKAIIDSFQEQIESLKTINPPLADAAYKANLTEQLTKANSISADLKKKQRSAQRRAGKEHDPLCQGLERIASTVTTLQHLIKCY